MPITIENNNELVSRNIIRDMSDGVVYTGPTGKILVVNDAATKILEKSREELVGKNFATCFFGYEENDAFNDCIVNMISQKDISPNKKVTDFYTGKDFKKLYLTTSYTQDDAGNISGTILILDDITQTMQLQERLFRNQLGTIMMMAELVESRDGSTGGHIRRTAEYVKIIAQQLLDDHKYPEVVTPEFIRDISTAAPLHDVGKINVPDTILNKPGRLTDEEFAIMKSHAATGRKILSDAVDMTEHSAYLDHAIDMAGDHHEWWNGRGYPRGIQGDQIPVSARIMAIADVFDALVSKRVYKPGMPLEKAYSIIHEETGSHFDPICVEAFFKAKEKIESAMNRLNDTPTPEQG